MAGAGGALVDHRGRVHWLQVLDAAVVLLARSAAVLMLEMLQLRRRVVLVVVLLLLLLLSACGRRGRGHVAVGQVAQRRPWPRHAALQILQQQICRHKILMEISYFCIGISRNLISY